MNFYHLKKVTVNNSEADFIDSLSSQLKKIEKIKKLIFLANGFPIRIADGELIIAFNTHFKNRSSASNPTRNKP